jgi:hypothetical protein
MKVVYFALIVSMMRWTGTHTFAPEATMFFLRRALRDEAEITVM